jgi:hypothetical protein
VNSASSITVSGVNLGAGSYQVYIQTSGGTSARSAAFTVQAAAVAPTLSGYSWNTTPTANQAFGGNITGTGFVAGAQVWFCVNGSSTCYQQPPAGVTVNNASSITVSGVNLGAGSYQVYIQTSGGTSARSAAFTVR